MSDVEPLRLPRVSREQRDLLVPTAGMVLDTDPPSVVRRKLAREQRTEEVKALRDWPVEVEGYSLRWERVKEERLQWWRFVARFRFWRLKRRYRRLVRRAMLSGVGR